MARRRGPGGATAGARAGQRGQSLVEFSLAIMIFLVLLVGTVDLARAIY
ncbi:MAG: TadE/TadG family type IV pilus assembly protein, partial [Chloroflexota bacterium]